MGKVERIGKPWVAMVFLATALQGCESGCDEETIDRAVAFLDSHQACETDDDCAVVQDYCGELPGGWCGQLPMNRAGAESAEWRELQTAVKGCAPTDCAVCTAALIPTCTNGSCRRQ